MRCVRQAWAPGFAVQVAGVKGASEWTYSSAFFSCLCAQISSQKTVGVQSPENQECLFPCFLVFTRRTLCLYSLIAEHSHLGLFLLIMRWDVHNCHRKTLCTCSSSWPDCKLTWADCASCPLYQKWMFSIILLCAELVDLLVRFGLDFSWFCCWVGFFGFLGGVFFSFFFPFVFFPAVLGGGGCVRACVCAFVVVLACLKWTVRERLGIKRNRFDKLVNYGALAKVLLTCTEWSLSCTG